MSLLRERKIPRLVGLGWIQTLLGVLSLVGWTGLVAQPTLAAAPAIESFDTDLRLGWTYPSNDQTNQLARIEVTDDLALGKWTPVFWELISTNPVLPKWSPVYFTPQSEEIRKSQMAQGVSPFLFYRVASQTNADASLMMHLSFDNDLSQGIVLDVSGNGNNGFRYEPTRWPIATVGPDGGQAARFHIYTDGFGTYKRSGDYITVRNSPLLDNLTNTTIAVWAYYDKYSAADAKKQWDSTLLDAGGFETTSSWTLGRLNAGATYFYLHWADEQGNGRSLKALQFPDLTTDGNTLGWHHYAVTFDGSTLRNYFDGRFVQSFSTNWLNKLILGGTYIGVGCWNFSATPMLYDGDFRPNNGWVEGSVDDIRIYNRTLGDPEVLSLYSSFDKRFKPSVPDGLWARAASSNQLELRWSASSDDFYVAGYLVRRNGILVGNVKGPSFVDQSLTPSTQYRYTVEAVDGGGNLSGESALLVTNTPAAGGLVEVIVDDADGVGRSEAVGSWTSAATAGSFGSGCIWGTESRGTKSVTFYPSLPGPGEYSVSIWYGGTPNQNLNYFYATNAPVDIVHAGATNVVLVNQQSGYKSWKVLGTFAFTGDTNEFVRIRTEGTAFHSSWGGVVADAVKFVK